MSLGIPSNTGIVESDPLLTRASDWLMRPDAAASSPLIDGTLGTYIDAVVDMDGKSRPVGAAKDVGADEVSTATVSRSPLTTADVGSTIGPLWYTPP